MDIISSFCVTIDLMWDLDKNVLCNCRYALSSSTVGIIILHPISGMTEI